MMNILLENYIKKLTIDDFRSLLNQNDINIKNDDITFFYNLIKTNYKDIIKNPEDYLNIIKSKVKDEDYNKIYELYLNYKNYLS